MGDLPGIVWRGQERLRREREAGSARYVPPAAARALVSVSERVRPHFDALWFFATFAARGMLTREECCAPVAEAVLERVREANPVFPAERVRGEVERGFDRYLERILRDMRAAEDVVGWTVRKMARGPMAPTEDDPQGERRASADELMAAARAANARRGGTLWTGPAHAGDEVLAVVEDALLDVMQARKARRR